MWLTREEDPNQHPRFKVDVIRTIHPSRFGTLVGQAVHVWEWSPGRADWIHRATMHSPPLIEGERPTQEQLGEWFVAELSKYLDPADLVESAGPGAADWEHADTASRCPAYVP